MDASHTCDMIISEIKSSNLNFSLKESLFSVEVSIKKTYIKDRNGNEISGPKESKLFIVKNNPNLVAENEALREDVHYLEKEKATLEHALNNLALKLEKAKHEIGELIEQKKKSIVSREIIEKDLAQKIIDNSNLETEINTIKKI